jgi:MoaA/NifB/PqqE/SkfB family radical SAM enzyme
MQLAALECVPNGNVDRNDVLHAWKHILTGYKPFLSIEITRECPLRCPGCYAYDAQHLGGGTTLRDLQDFRGDALVARVLALVDELRPLHLSIVGGDPLVRFRELEVLLPALEARGIHVQVVTSAFRAIPESWAGLPHLSIIVSVDGLPPEHDARRRPATYDRILANVAGRHVTVHWTITAQALSRPTYIREFMDFWSPRPEVRRIWISLFTPQKGDRLAEILTPEQRDFVIQELLKIRPEYSKLDMKEAIIREFARPPASPKDCIFARTAGTVSADLRTRVTPCQFGGNPDCSQCGCIASMGLASLGHTKLLPGVDVGRVLVVSDTVGQKVNQGRTLLRSIKCQLSSMRLRACSRFWPRSSKLPAC